MRTRIINLKNESPAEIYHTESTYTNPSIEGISTVKNQDCQGAEHHLV